MNMWIEHVVSFICVKDIIYSVAIFEAIGITRDYCLRINNFVFFSYGHIWLCINKIAIYAS